MSNRHLFPRDADRILDAPAESDLPVARALEALRAPGTAAELLREDAAVAAFHAARLATPPPARSPSRGAAARAVAATGLVVALTSGGLALAATGHLPALPGQASEGSSEAASDDVVDRARDRASEPAGRPTTRRGATRTGSPSAAAADSPSGSTSGSPSDGASVPATTTGPTPAIPSTTTTPTPGPDQGATPAPSGDPSPGTTPAPGPRLEGLCTAFQAVDRSAQGKALDSPAFAALVAVAGGKGAVATYCVSLVGEPSATPTSTGQPASGPTPTPLVKPTPAPTAPGTAPGTTPGAGKPTTVPSPTAPPGRPTAAPSGASAAGEPRGPGSH